MLKKDRNRKTIVIFTLWLAYAAMYLGRQNMAIALPVMEQELGWNPTMAGIITGVFFWFYAVGQLINGYLGDQVDCKRIVLFGLIASCVANGLLPFVNTFWAMVLLWAMNGYVQSTGWGPILKIASHWTEEHERAQVAGFLATSGIAGFFASWAISGGILLVTSWHWVFAFPAIVLGCISILWSLQVESYPNTAHQAPPAKDSGGLKTNMLEFIKYPGVLGLGLVSFLQGMIRNGIILWTPTLLAHTLFDGTAAIPSLLIPLFGLVGIGISTRLLSRLKGNDQAAITILLALAGILALVSAKALKWEQALLLAFTIASCAAFMEGANTVLLTSIPLKFARVGKQSTMAGFLDFASYMGAAFMSIFTGIILERWNWNAIVVSWAIVCIIASILTWLLARTKDTAVQTNDWTRRAV